MSTKRRQHNANFKSEVAIAAIRGDKTIAQLSKEFNISQSRITESCFFVGSSPTIKITSYLYIDNSLKYDPRFKLHFAAMMAFVLSYTKS